MTTTPRLLAAARDLLARREVVLMVALFAAAALLLGFGLLAAEVIEGDTAAFDKAVLALFRAPGNPADPIGPAWLEEMARDVTALGSFALLGIVVLLSTGYLVLAKKPAQALLMFGAVVGGTVVSTALKLGFDRPRPDILGAPRVFTASFPSGHAMLSAVTFLTLGALLAASTTDLRLRGYCMGAALALTLLVGLSRLYLGVHYPTDVIAGWCVGSAWALLCWTTAQWLQKTRAVEPPGGEATDVRVG
jgi:undecaprenyl-diphosphatase